MNLGRKHNWGSYGNRAVKHREANEGADWRLLYFPTAVLGEGGFWRWVFWGVYRTDTKIGEGIA